MAKTKKQGGLGFKNITIFNDALPAKIGWRILKNPSISLLVAFLVNTARKNPF